MASGYSGTPLAKKLGLKEKQVILLVNAPENYFDWFESLPDGLESRSEREILKDFIHLFTKDAAEMELELIRLRAELRPNGSLWVSWPKKASKVPTDVTEDAIRNAALRHGLVDVKVCAVDEVWSGLKLVIPVHLR